MDEEIREMLCQNLHNRKPCSLRDKQYTVCRHVPLNIHEGKLRERMRKEHVNFVFFKKTHYAVSTAFERKNFFLPLLHIKSRLES